MGAQEAHEDIHAGQLAHLIWNVWKCMKHRLLHLWQRFNVYVYVLHLSGLCCGILPMKMYGAYGLQAHGPCFFFFLFCPLPLAFNQRSCLTAPRSQIINILFWNILNISYYFIVCTVTMSSLGIKMAAPFLWLTVVTRCLRFSRASPCCKCSDLTSFSRGDVFCCVFVCVKSFGSFGNIVFVSKCWSWKLEVSQYSKIFRGFFQKITVLYDLSRIFFGKSQYSKIFRGFFQKITALKDLSRIFSENYSTQRSFEDIFKKSQYSRTLRERCENVQRQNVQLGAGRIGSKKKKWQTPFKFYGFVTFPWRFRGPRKNTTNYGNAMLKVWSTPVT